MLRKTRSLIAALLLVGFLALAQGDMIPGLILSDLQLISHESLDHWTSAWTGPVQAATIIAWFAEHGFPRLLPDLNGDGVVDVLDTIELADRFGTEGMRTDTPDGTTDATLVMTLSTYIAGKYPDAFILKVYDSGFSDELVRDGYGPYSPEMIDGIKIITEGEPSIPAYQEELLRGETIIAGLEEDPEENTYLAGRSFLRERTPEGFTPLGFAWSKEDRLEPGHQGSILDTVGKMDDGFYVDFLDWTLVEFMLAVSPTDEFAVGSPESPCPEGALAYHEMTYSLGVLGEVSVSECVTRGGDIDTYTYTVTNIDYEGPGDGCGICRFMIPNPGLITLAHGEPVAWTFTSLPDSWHWWLPLGSCGLLPGDSAVFSVSVPGPTVDAWVDGGLGFCYTGPGIPDLLVHPIRTTGPSGSGCPDLIVQNPVAECLFDEAAGEYKVVVSAEVLNIGDAPAIGDFDLLCEDTMGHVTSERVSGGLPSGASIGVTLQYAFPGDEVQPGGIPSCPMPLALVVDAGHEIAECDEENNVDDEGSVCCAPRPGSGELPDCPDLVIEIIRDDCTWDCPYELCIAHTEVTVEVTNIGSAPTGGSFLVRVESKSGQGEDKTVPGLSAGRSRRLTFDLYSIDRCLRYRAIADLLDEVTECNEENNEVEGSECCPAS